MQWSTSELEHGVKFLKPPLPETLQCPSALHPGPIYISQLYVNLLQ